MPQIMACLFRYDSLRVSRAATCAGLLPLRHHPAFIGASLAFVCAFYAVVILEHLAVLRTLVADGGAKRTEFLRVLRVHHHETACIRADAGAFRQHADALLSCLYIRLVQAHPNAFPACLCAAVAGINALLIFVRSVSHNAHSCSPPFILP